MIIENFRNEDQVRVQKEHWCIENGMDLVEEMLEVGQYDLAIKRAEEIVKSAKEIERLAKVKKEADSVRELLLMLRTMDIQIEGVLRYGRGW